MTRLTLILLVCCLAVPDFAGDATFKFTETRRLVKGYTKPEIVVSEGGTIAVNQPVPEYTEPQAFGIVAYVNSTTVTAAQRSLIEPLQADARVLDPTGRIIPVRRGDVIVYQKKHYKVIGQIGDRVALRRMEDGETFSIPIARAAADQKAATPVARAEPAAEPRAPRIELRPATESEPADDPSLEVK